MSESQRHANERIKIAKDISSKFKKYSTGIILAGSVAYAPKTGVKETSDVDLIIIVEDLKKVIPKIIKNKLEQEKLKNRFFEGYCIKINVENIPISLHFLSSDAFEIISKCFVADIRVYREIAKEERYLLYGFERNLYEYKIKNIKLSDLNGVRTIVPISFINNDRYFIGIHRDKLLSNPIVLWQRKKYVSEKIEKLWKVVVQNLRDESIRLHGSLDISKMNILNALAKSSSMDEGVKRLIRERTTKHIKKLNSHSFSGLRIKKVKSYER